MHTYVRAPAPPPAYLNLVVANRNECTERLYPRALHRRVIDCARSKKSLLDILPSRAADFHIRRTIHGNEWSVDYRLDVFHLFSTEPRSFCLRFDLTSPRANSLSIFLPCVMLSSRNNEEPVDVIVSRFKSIQRKRLGFRCAPELATVPIFFQSEFDRLTEGAARKLQSHSN